MPKVETAITLDAFRLYLEAGGINLDFLGKFQEKFGKGKSTAYGWEKDLNWKARAKEPIDEAVEEELAERKLDAEELIGGFLDMCDASLKGIDIKAGYLDAIFGTAFGRIPTPEKPEPENPLEIKSLDDMDKVAGMITRLMKAKQDWAKLALLLVGEPDSRADVNVSVTRQIQDGNFY